MSRKPVYNDPKLNRWGWLFRQLNRRLLRLIVSDGVYYWLLDRLTNNDGWRPLSIRDSE